MADSPIHLTILRRGDIHIVDLAEVQAIIPRSETRVDATFLEEISQEIKRITNLVGPDFRKAAETLEPEVARNLHVVRELKNLGSLIFSHLLPKAARDKLRNAETCNLYLRLDDQLVHIPWELAFDGEHFLGMKFRVGRQVITHHKVSQPPAKASSGALKVLIISDPSETLKNVSRETEQLCEILDKIPGLEVRLIGGRGVKRIPLLGALRENDIVHFAGHSQFDEKNPENSGWLLHDGLLSASEISKLDQAPLLVFSNSCQAGATKKWQSEYLYEGEAFGLGSAFLLAGVRNYIGTFCVVHDEESRFLAAEFYRRVAQRKSIGEALLEARLATAEEMGLDRLTWASYMLYGDPAYSLSVVPEVQFEPVPGPPGNGLPHVSTKTLPVAIPAEPRSWRFRWPRLNLRLSISITLGMLALAVFGNLLRTKLYEDSSRPDAKSQADTANTTGRRNLPEPMNKPDNRGVTVSNEPALPSAPPRRESIPNIARSRSLPQSPGTELPARQQQIEAQRSQQLQPSEQTVAPSNGTPPNPNIYGRREVNPKILDHLRIAKFFRERGEYAKALVELEKAKSLDPKNRDVQLELENLRQVYPDRQRR